MTVLLAMLLVVVAGAVLVHLPPVQRAAWERAVAAVDETTGEAFTDTDIALWECLVEYLSATFAPDDELPADLITMGGVPTRATRRFIRKLSDERKITSLMSALYSASRILLLALFILESPAESNADSSLSFSSLCAPNERLCCF